MRIIRWLFLMAVCVVLVSCSDTERYTQYINEQLESHYPSEAEKYYCCYSSSRLSCVYSSCGIVFLYYEKGAELSFYFYQNRFAQEVEVGNRGG